MKNKLQRVPREDKSNLDHPLHELFLQIEQLDSYDHEAVYSFFNAMQVPDGFYAITTTDEYGYWIEFYKLID
jgi:hypothetical protein